MLVKGPPDKRAGPCPQTRIHLGKRTARKESKERRGGKERKKKNLQYQGIEKARFQSVEQHLHCIKILGFSCFMNTMKDIFLIL